MKRKLTVCLLALLAALSLLVGCSSKGNSMADSYPGDSYDGSNGSTGMEGKPSEEVKPDGTGGEYERKIIRTVSMHCESKAFDEAVSAVMTALEAHGGYVENSSLSGTKSKSVATVQPVGQARWAEYTLRVPAEQLDAFLNALRVEGNIRILSQSMTSNEITGSYYDTATRLQTLQAEEDSLRAMLEGITDYANISAMLEVRERLYNVMEEKEALQTRLNLYDSQVSLSTVKLSLSEVLEYTAEEEPTFGERVGEAFTESWTAFGEGCQDFAVWFVEALPTLLVWTVILGVALVIFLRVRRRKRGGKPSDRS